MALQVSPQIRDRFPLQEALAVATTLNYPADLLVPLLSAISHGVNLALLDRQQASAG